MHQKRIVAVILLAFALTGLFSALGHAQEEPDPDPIFGVQCLTLVSNETQNGNCDVRFTIRECGPDRRIFVCTLTVCTNDKKGYLQSSVTRECHY